MARSEVRERPSASSARIALRSIRAANALLDFTQQRLLISKNFGHGERQREVGDPIDLGKALPQARSRRPLHLEHIAGEAGKIEVDFGGESVHGLAGLLVNRRKRDHRARDFEAGLFGKFAPCRGDKLFAGADQTFRYRPYALIFLCPEGTAGMPQQHFKLFAAAKRQDTGTDFLIRGASGLILLLAAALYRRTFRATLAK